MHIYELFEDDDPNNGDLHTLNDRQDAPAAGQAGANASPTFSGSGTASPNAEEAPVNPARTTPDANKQQVAQTNNRIVKGASRFEPTGAVGLPNQASSGGAGVKTNIPDNQYIQLVNPQNPNEKPQLFKLGDLISSITNQAKE